MESSAVTPIFPPLSRTHKAQKYLPKNACGKRKRPDGDGGVSFEVRPSVNGVGMFATKRISCGDLIIADEDPIVHCRSSVAPGKPNVCNVCSAPIGSLRKTHLRAPDGLALPLLEDDDHDISYASEITCRICNAVTWCSDECRQREGVHHAFLCRRAIEDPALERFYDRIRSGGQESPIIFELAARCVTLILSQLVTLIRSQHMSDIEKYFWWRDYGSHPLWWEIGLPSTEEIKRREDAAKDFCDVLTMALIAREGRELVDEAAVRQICTRDNIGSILGMLQCNVMEFEYPSPSQQYMEHVGEIVEMVATESECSSSASNDEDAMALKDGCRWLLENMSCSETKEACARVTTGDRQHKLAVGPITGSGLYPLLTLANHDCNPNASIEFLQESNRGTMVATRDIDIGEEIRITYVPNGGVGCGDGGDYFRHFSPTRTWKWLNSEDGEGGGGDNDGDSVEESLEGGDDNFDEDGSSARDHEDAEPDSDQEAAEEALEGSNQIERANALLNCYGFKCRCRRCS